MKTELKEESFEYSHELCDFINDREITKGNIQSIIFADGWFHLFYWEVTP